MQDDDAGEADAQTEGRMMLDRYPSRPTAGPAAPTAGGATGSACARIGWYRICRTSARTSLEWALSYPVQLCPLSRKQDI
jgi:hypothetical protein